MILRILFLLLTIKTMAGVDPLLTRKANKAKEEAELATASKDYQAAVRAYNYLLDTLKIKDDNALLNLAHVYMKKADYTNAINKYTEVTLSDNSRLKSVAAQQLGILQAERGNREEAKSYFKNAIKWDPSNTQARYNYELLMKNKDKEIPKSQDQKQRQEEEKKNQQQQKDKKDQEQKNQDQNQENKEQGNNGKNEDKQKNKGQKENSEGKEGEKQEQKKNEEGKSDKNKEGADNQEKGKENKDKEENGNKSSKNKEDENSKEKGKTEKPAGKGDEKKDKETPQISVNKEQLKKINMTEHQAKALLDAMRQGEIQYIQQMKRKSDKKDSNPKKDW